MVNGFLFCGFILLALCLLAYTVMEKTKLPDKKDRKWF